MGSSHHPCHDRSSSEALSTPGGADSRQAGQKAFVSNCSSQEVRWLGGLVISNGDGEGGFGLWWIFSCD